MNLNLKTTIKAYPRMSPSILKDYATKEDLETRPTFEDTQEIIDENLEGYMNACEVKNTIKDSLKGYLRAEDCPSDGNIYGLSDGKWVSVVDIPQKITDILCYGMSENDEIEPDALINFNRKGMFNVITEYAISADGENDGYFWVCCSKEIKDLVACNGFHYLVPIYEQNGLIPLTIDGKRYEFHCYRTEKLEGYKGLTYKFRARLKYEVKD